MTAAPTPSTVADALPLYPSEAEIAVLVLGKKRAGLWRELAAFEERRGLPRVDPVFGARYWPAVRAYFDRRAGLRKDSIPAVPDGKDNFDEQPRGPRAGFKNHQATGRAQEAVLDR